MRFQLKKLGFVLLVLSSSSLYAAPDLKQCESSQCQAIIDAGSSGSRLYIYAKNNQSQSWQQIWSKKVTPGLSSIAPSAVGSYFDSLMEPLPSTNMPISVYGTAGMRLLSEQEQQQRYQAVSSWFQGHAQWQLKNIRTITGQEEGVFAWLAVQSEMHLLNQSSQNLKSVIEVGGASTQVTIPVSKQELAQYAPEDIYTLNLKGQPLYVWSKSFLGLGMNEVEKQFSNDTYCYTQGFSLSSGLLGQGDASQCISDIENQPHLQLFQIFQAAKDVVTNHPKSSWVALGALKFTVETPPFHFEQHTFSLKDMRQLGDNEFCHQTWEQLSPQARLYPFIYRQCFGISYFYSAFADAMGLNDEENLYFPDQQAQMDWTLGALLISDLVENANKQT